MEAEAWLPLDDDLVDRVLLRQPVPSRALRRFVHIVFTPRTSHGHDGRDPDGRDTPRPPGRRRARSAAARPCEQAKRTPMPATGLERRPERVDPPICHWKLLMPGAQYCTEIGKRKVHHSRRR